MIQKMYKYLKLTGTVISMQERWIVKLHFILWSYILEEIKHKETPIGVDWYNCPLVQTLICYISYCTKKNKIKSKSHTLKNDTERRLVVYHLLNENYKNYFQKRCIIDF